MNQTTQNNDTTFYYNFIITEIPSVFFNGLIVFSMFRYKTISNLSNLLLVLILCSNMIGSFGYLGHCIEQAWIKLQVLSYIFYKIDIVNGWFISISYCLFLSIHRYRAIKYPFDQNEKISFKNNIFIFVYSAFLIVSFLIPSIFLPGNIFESVAFIIIIAIIVLCFIFLGLSISMINSKRKKFEHYGQVLNHRNKKETKKLKKETRAIICLLAISLNITLCHMPYSILVQLSLFKQINIETIHEVYLTTFFIIRSYRLTDPFLLIIFNKNVRSNFKKLLLIKNIPCQTR